MSVGKFNAQLVAKGFHQRLGIDYKETFSPMIKPAIIQIVFCIALSNG